jgi:hypothetical protein
MFLPHVARFDRQGVEIGEVGLLGRHAHNLSIEPRRGEAAHPETIKTNGNRQ